MLKRSLMLLTPLLLATACTPVDYGFGESVRATIAQQVVDPDPQYRGDIMEGGSAERGAAAIQRYNSGQVRQPVQTSTTSGVGGSSGGNSSSSGTSGSGPR